MYAALCIQFLLYYSFSWCHHVIVSIKLFLVNLWNQNIASAVGECIIKTTSCIMQSALCGFHNQVVDPSSLPITNSLPKLDWLFTSSMHLFMCLSHHFTCTSHHFTCSSHYFTCLSHHFTCSSHHFMCSSHHFTCYCTTTSLVNHVHIYWSPYKVN